MEETKESAKVIDIRSAKDNKGNTKTEHESMPKEVQDEINRLMKENPGASVKAIEITVDGSDENPFETISRQIAAALVSLKPRRYVMDKDLNPVPADDMPEKKWKEFMENYGIMQRTRYGSYQITTAFTGISMAKDGDKPKLFATVVHKGGKILGGEKAETAEEAAKNHTTVLNAAKANVVRWPWQIVSNVWHNKEWV